MSNKTVDIGSLAHLLPGSESPKEEAPFTLEMEAVDPEFSKLYNERVDILRSYLVLAENPADLQDENFRRTVFSKLSYGLRKAGDYLGWALYHQRMAYAKRKQAEAIAALDQFGGWLEGRKAAGIEAKATVDVRAHYVNIDPGTIAAASREALMDAAVQQLATMKSEFTMAITTIRALMYGKHDSDYMSGSAAAANSQQ